ncbi:MAG: dephospho-CoA kinase [Ignavibacteriae bacterium]|nr:dephospho-CoA kinase [Ignavibacteriota bacterium]NOG99119.1 dephospho-CoA kinase [Ignavibacteriota bacterium]
MKKIKVGITGGIGTGKTTAANLFKEKGYQVFSADDIAKEIMVSDESVIEKIKTEFGEESFQDGELNKKYLAENVFSDEAKILLINSIVHPPTLEKIETGMNEALMKEDIVFAESALIFEAEFETMFDYIILVTSTDENKIERVMKSRKISREEVIKRINNQMPDDEKRKGSDFVIENNSTLEDLKSKAEFILSLIENMVGV